MIISRSFVNANYSIQKVLILLNCTQYVWKQINANYSFQKVLILLNCTQYVWKQIDQLPLHLHLGGLQCTRSTASSECSHHQDDGVHSSTGHTQGVGQLLPRLIN